MATALGASDIILVLAVGITNRSSVKNLPPILNEVVNFRIFEFIPVTTLVFAVYAGVNSKGGRRKVKKITN